MQGGAATGSDPYTPAGGRGGGQGRLAAGSAGKSRRRRPAASAAPSPPACVLSAACHVGAVLRLICQGSGGLVQGRAHRSAARASGAALGASQPQPPAGTAPPQPKGSNIFASPAFEPPMLPAGASASPGGPRRLGARDTDRLGPSIPARLFEEKWPLCGRRPFLTRRISRPASAALLPNASALSRHAAITSSSSEHAIAACRAASAAAAACWRRRAAASSEGRNTSRSTAPALYASTRTLS
ncbi:MAG: hypothetical protein J3K34DRAFT_412264 [Monoraphidium minutum]|nr:MAG: hypothetical protein J3K34DRAFT_412264 [Monoraphidium minutum]